MTEPLLETAKSTAQHHGMFPEATAVVALVSGGADSTALLRSLASGEFGEMRVSVLHINHMLRGGDADRDAAFVEELCVRLSVPCRTVRYDVGAWAEESGLNLEDAGRRVRYRFAEEELDAVCDAAGVPRPEGRIATAHTLDDRIETFLMRLVQGAGAGGLGGPAYQRGRIVRPLLDVRRADVVAYLQQLGQPWREDATNADVTRLRARVRAELLPLMEEMNPRFDDAVSRALAVLGDENELLDSMARAFASDFVEREGSHVVAFDRARMQTLSRAMARRTVRAALIGAFPESSRLEFEHVEALVEGLGDARFARDLPYGLRAQGEYDRLVISRSDEEAAPLAPALLEIPGSVDLGDAGAVFAEFAQPDEMSGDPMEALVDAARVTDALVVDSVRAGDRMRPLGMEGTRKLSDMLVDAKVPRRRRGRTPVVRHGEEIVWLAGIRMSEEYRLTDGTHRCVRLRWTGPVSEGADE